MGPNQAVFHLMRRINVHTEKGHQWALNVVLDRDHTWTLCTWETEPSEQVVDHAKNLFLRSCKVYHEQLQVHPFALTERK